MSFKAALPKIQHLAEIHMHVQLLSQNQQVNLLSDGETDDLPRGSAGSMVSTL